MTKLSQQGGTTIEQDSPFQKLKEAVQRSVRELIALNDSECVAMMDRWFEDSYPFIIYINKIFVCIMILIQSKIYLYHQIAIIYQEQLILQELADYPEIQFNYVRKFINQNEEKIKATIAEATYSSQKKQEAQRYVEYLVLHTKLLCKFERDQVHEYVKRDYYPTQECLEICKEEKITRAVAELLRRNGNFMESMRSYLDIINNELDKKEMMQELYQNSKHLKPNNNAIIYLYQNICRWYSKIDSERIINIQTQKTSIFYNLTQLVSAFRNKNKEMNYKNKNGHLFQIIQHF